MTVTLVIGDDFTPAALLAGAIRAHPRFREADVDLRLLDLEADAPFTQSEREGVSEFIGDPDSLLDAVADVDAIVTTFAPVNRRVLAAAPSLELVVCGRGGPVNIDVEAASELGVEVRSCAGRNADAVAEFVLGLLVSLTRAIPRAAEYVKAGDWTDAREDSLRKPTGPQLGGRTLGIVGFGAIGQRVARLVSPLGMKVLAFDPFVSSDVMSSAGVQGVELAHLLAHSDIVTIHARPPSDGRPLIGQEELQEMKPGSYLINTSRGVNVDERALLQALDSDHLAGAALDVARVEPMGAENPFLHHPNVIVTPHVAGVSTDVPGHTADLVADALLDWLDPR